MPPLILSKIYEEWGVGMELTKQEAVTVLAALDAVLKAYDRAKSLTDDAAAACAMVHLVKARFQVALDRGEFNDCDEDPA